MRRRRHIAVIAACIAAAGLSLAPVAQAAPAAPSAPTHQASPSPSPDLDPQNAQRRAQELEAAARPPGLPAGTPSKPTSDPLPAAKPRQTCAEALEQLQASEGEYTYGSCFEPVAQSPRHRGLEPTPWPGVPSWCHTGQTTRLHRQDACTYPGQWAYRIFDVRGTLIGSGVIEIVALEVTNTRSLNILRSVNVRILATTGSATAATLSSWGNCYGQYCTLTSSTPDNKVPLTVGSSYRDYREAAVDPLPGQAFWTYWVGGLVINGPPNVEIQPATLDFPYSSRIRCDRNMIGNSTDGCVFPDYWPTFVQDLGRTDPVTGVAEAAQHIQDAQNTTRNRWGLEGVGKPLSRTQDDSLARQNRTASCGGRPPSPPGQSCDEYPFAHTYEGAALQGRGDFSARDINEKHNSNSGNEMAIMWGAMRVVDRDYFWVRVVP